jgi:tetratricopeptide (TPR) repeat protein
MRLLELDSHGHFSLTDFEHTKIPQYAILSHTWGVDGEEVSFRDIMEGTGSSKAGYQKLRFCQIQAEKDGLRYFWIDTCCIDQRNITELQRAINSMFRWYQSATKCYVYLEDVTTNENHMNERDSQIRQSRWFTRGWTLQELIAPQSVEFFSRNWERLGNKEQLEQQLHQITGISLQALRGEPLSRFSISERMSWAARREVTKEEDAAYCLLGIFQLFMPLIYGEGRQNALNRLRREMRNTLHPKPLISEKAPWVVPFERNHLFTGRDMEIDELEKMLFDSEHTTKIAVTGLGGVGKTQIVLELLYRTKEKYTDCSVIWISAINMESLHRGYIDTAQQLGIPGSENEKADIKRLVKEYLSKATTGRWLLVLDNADDIDMWTTTPRSELNADLKYQLLMDYLPKGKHISIVFTTRNRKLGIKFAGRNIMEIREMGEEESLQLLQKCLIRSPISRSQDTVNLLAALEYLPLAIVQASAFINENGITLVDYLKLLNGPETEVVDLLSEEFEDDGRYHDSKNPIATTWLVSFEQIRQRDLLAADYLSFISCVDPREIPQSLLPLGPSRKKEMDAIGTLSAYSIITRRPEDTTFDLHRLIHLATRNWLRKEDILGQWTERAIDRLNEVFPGHDHQNRKVWRAYLPHAAYVLNSDVIDRYGDSRIDLVWKYGMCLYQDGRWNEASASFEQVMEARAMTLGQDHPDTISAMSNLAITLGDLGRLWEAMTMKKKVLEMMRRVLGEDHLSTITAMNNLASTLGDLGQLDEAARMKEEVLRKRRLILGEEHPSTIIAMNNLASMLGDLGQLDEASNMQKKVLEQRKRTLGEDHPDTNVAMSNLAITLGKLGKLDEAANMAREVVEQRKRIFGEHHPDTTLAMNNLAITLEDLGQIDEAISLLDVAVQRMKRVHGEEHPRTAIAVSNLTRLSLIKSTYEMGDGKMDTGVKVEPDPAEAHDANVTTEDAVIVVLGPTGVGKSHFIHAATGDSSIKIGTSLESCMSYEQSYPRTNN